MNFKTMALAPFIILVTQPVFSEPVSREFSEIEILGNNRFSDQDILATANLGAGRTLGQVDLEQAVENLDYTGEFKEISITSDGDQLIIEVIEQPEYSGALTFALGYDSDFGALGSADLRLEDVFTTGFDINGQASISKEFQKANLEFVHSQLYPDTNIGLRLAYASYDFDKTLFDYATMDIQPFVSYAFSEQSSIELRYTYRTDKIDNVDPTASTILQADSGTATASLIGISFKGSGILQGDAVSWDAQASFDTTAGSGDLDYSRLAGPANLFVPLSDSGWALRSRVEAGAIRSKSTHSLPRASDRFSLGGAALRGFERGGVTVRDDAGAVVTDLGGNTFATIRNEIILPVLREKHGLDLFVFADLGSVWGLETNVSASGTLDTTRSWRTSNGVGMSYETPLGYFEGYYAVTAKGQSGDSERALGLTFRSDF